uniref:SFRICE_032245 n=1 Tax=Spodoptera frugiperda TaxID=7108 RepID=A0A2H1W0V5_SPOFR
MKPIFTSEDMLISRISVTGKPKVTVWCAMSASPIIAPYFFENERGRTVTVNSERYAQMLNDFFRLELQNSPSVNRNTWFLQDGATVHTANVSTNAVRQLFSEKIISRNGILKIHGLQDKSEHCDTT